MKAPKDLKGHQSGLLTVTAPAGLDYRGLPQWNCRCECGASAIVGDKALRHRTTRSCGCLARGRSIIVTPSMAQKFWSVIGEDHDPDACWDWPLARSPRGYGQMTWRGRALAAHRVAAAIRMGGTLEGRMEASHRCDNPSCCNPAHLAQESHRENHRGGVERGRYAISRGPKDRRALTQKKADAIRKKRAAGATAKSLAEEYGVDIGHIYRVCTGKIWNKGRASK